MMKEMSFTEETAPDELSMGEHGVEDERATKTEVNKSGKHVLCVGAGKGHEMEAILNEFPGIKVTGVDPHDYYGPPVERRLKESGRDVQYLHESVHAGDLKEIPDNSVDAATLLFVLHHIDASEHDQVMAELRRVLKPNGKVFVAEDLVDTEAERKTTVMMDKLLNTEVLSHGPHNYKNQQDWEAYFEGQGFRMKREREIKPSKVRHGFFVLERILDKETE
jgi:ubiquinone/menaquinone biosynthesis C-methylase UbiE